MTLTALWKSVGRAYDVEQACVMPIYIMWPDMPRFEVVDEPGYIWDIINKYCDRVPEKDLKAGDLLVFDFGDKRHFGIYAGRDKFFHVSLSHKLRVSPLRRYRKWLTERCRRVR
jgi:cell wall-associated NlpC family hydrolase